MHDSPSHTILNGITGLAGAMLSYISTTVQDLTAWMQLGSFFAGMLVSILMCIKLWRDLIKTKKK
jgi:ABC-type nickel/cobalt efflux system permease component RcnA